MKGYKSRIQTVYEEGFEIGKMLKMNQKNIIKPVSISFTDLPDKELLKHILKLLIL